MPKRDVQEYLNELYLRLNQASLVPKRNVELDGRRPTQGNCHDNVGKYCKSASGHKHIYGWLIADFSELGDIWFIFHSVAQGPDGELFDITPTDAEFEYPFLDSNLSDEAYLGLIHTHNGEPKIVLTL